MGEGSNVERGGGQIIKYHSTVANFSKHFIKNTLLERRGLFIISRRFVGGGVRD